MNLKLNFEKINLLIEPLEIIGANNCTQEIDVIYTDTRKIRTSKGAAFVALKGIQSNGIEYIPSAYNLGIRTFIIAEKPLEIFPDACYFIVKDTLSTLGKIAQWKRKQFKGQLIAITGRIGKTTVKEWLYHFLSPEMLVTRSPKSYNSELGIIRSILEMNEAAEIAIIEVKPHSELSFETINRIIQPNIAVLTSSDGAGVQFPDSYYEQLFAQTDILFHSSRKRQFEKYIGTKINVPLIDKQKFPSDTATEAQLMNVSLAMACAEHISDGKIDLKEKLASLPELALRMDTYEGIQDNFIINDLYNLDEEALINALEFQQTIAHGRECIVILSTEGIEKMALEKFREIIAEHKVQRIIEIPSIDFQTDEIQNSVVLIKGKRNAQINRLINKFKLKKHLTHVRIDLKALRKNIVAHKKMVDPETKMLLMIKASGYGSEIDKMVHSTQSFGIDYYGVAFVDEGIAIRKTGCTLPIMIMNVEPGNYEACIEWDLEPAIYDFQQLDDFISECIYQGIENYPIHIKLDTGMRRLGFEIEQINQLIEILKAQPEIQVKSVYSHLAEAENSFDKRFSEHQILNFKKAVNKLAAEIHTDFDTHIQNSSGIAQYGNINCSMIRLGIGMYGVANVDKIRPYLEPVLSWYSTICQIKTIEKGQTVGYNRTFTADKTIKIAVVPIGYADGLKRSLSNGVGELFVKGIACPIVGRVSMDMVMIDVTKANAKLGDEVEIIGIHQSIEKLAKMMNTIPYEVMTSIAPRVHRMYVEK